MTKLERRASIQSIVFEHKKKELHHFGTALKTICFHLTFCFLLSTTRLYGARPAEPHHSLQQSNSFISFLSRIFALPPRRLSACTIGGRHAAR